MVKASIFVKAIPTNKYENTLRDTGDWKWTHKPCA